MPTKDQLLREAADKEALAVTFLRYARALPEALEDLPSRPGDYEPFWRGPAAQRFITQVLRLRRELDDLEDDCLATARACAAAPGGCASRPRRSPAPPERGQCAPTSDDSRWAR